MPPRKTADDVIVGMDAAVRFFGGYIKASRALGLPDGTAYNALHRSVSADTERRIRDALGMGKPTPRTHREGHRVRVSHADVERAAALGYTAQQVWALGMAACVSRET